MPNRYVLAFFCFLSISPVSYASQNGTGQGNYWNLMTVTNGGNVSVIKSITERECVFMRDRLLGHPATNSEKEAAEKRNAEKEATWERWKSDNGCNKGDTWGFSSGPNVKLEDGTCLRGVEVRIEHESDIRSAECFR